MLYINFWISEKSAYTSITIIIEKQFKDSSSVTDLHRQRCNGAVKNQDIPKWYVQRNFKTWKFSK